MPHTDRTDPIAYVKLPNPFSLCLSKKLSALMSALKYPNAMRWMMHLTAKFISSI